MFKSLLIKTTIAALTLGSLSVSADESIDLFSDNQDFMQVLNGSDSDSVLGADIIGGERDIEVIAGDDVRASTEVRNGQLLIASSGLGGGAAADDSFSVEVQWDGLDDSSVLDTDGLAPAADFSSLNGFSAEINKSDGAGSFDVTIYDTAGHMAELMLPFIPVAQGFPQTFTIPFAIFAAINPLLDLSSVGAIVLKLASSGDTDIRVEAIRAVPAPSSLAVLGLGLLGFAGFARRKA